MKICYLATASSRATKRWVEYFANKGHEIDLITFSYVNKAIRVPIPEKTYKNMKNVKLHKIRKRIYLDPISIYKIRKIINKIKPDILHAHQVTPYGVYGALSGFHPFIASPWGSDIATLPERSKILKFFVNFTLRRADLVNFYDKPTKERLIELGCDEQKLIFLNVTGVDTEKFSPQKRSKKLRKELGIEDSYSVLNARHLEPHYNVDVFIKAIPHVLKEIENIKFIVAGEGPEEEKLKELAKRLGVREYIVFLCGVPHEEMPKYLASVDVYVESMKGSDKAGGGMGTTVLEAMACGTPLLLSERTYLRKYGKTMDDLRWFHGLVYEPLNYKDMAKKIVELLKNRKLRKKLGRKSRKAAIEYGNWKKTAEEWEKIYYDLKP